MKRFFQAKVFPFFKKIRSFLVFSLVLIVLAIATLKIYSLFNSGYVFPQWTGFVSYYDDSGEFHPAKTLWDVLDLLIIPIVISIGGLLFNRAEKNRETRNQEQRHKTDLEIAENRRKQDQENIADQQRSSMLQRYLDDIAILLLKENLNKDLNLESPVIQIARVKTLTTLRVLENDIKRMDIIFQFLRDSGLAEYLFLDATIGKINLKGVNLDNVVFEKSDLREANLCNSSFYSANCTNTDFSNALLHNCWFYHAKLNEADFYKAELIGSRFLNADLEKAKLIGANLTRVDFGNANLKGASLVQAKLNDAKLSGADFTGADLSHAELNGANLGESVPGIKELFDILDMDKSTKLVNANLTLAQLKNADMSMVDLTNANLSSANLTNAKISAAQLKLAKTLNNVTLPNGKKYENLESLENL